MDIKVYNLLVASKAVLKDFDEGCRCGCIPDPNVEDLLRKAIEAFEQ